MTILSSRRQMASREPDGLNFKNAADTPIRFAMPALFRRGKWASSNKASHLHLARHRRSHVGRLPMMGVLEAREATS
jgi:hypothetical protein